jgi:hypothetical protein
MSMHRRDCWINRAQRDDEKQAEVTRSLCW